jgi:high-affinity iron transporter
MLISEEVFAIAGHIIAAVADRGSTSGVLDIGVLVFREGLESILVLAAVSAGTSSSGKSAYFPIGFGAAVAFVATLITWLVAVHVTDNLSQNFSALEVQAATGLLAIVVLLLVMNWFFHKVYWTGWISAHTRKKRDLLAGWQAPEPSKLRLVSGMGLLGFTSIYREGVEVVLFLQSYRLRLGRRTVLDGTLLGLFLTAIVAFLTFVAHRRLPFKKMLVLTGSLLGLVLLVMVGEQAQEMQLVHWLSVTPISWLAALIPQWMGFWLSVFPTVETLSAQAVAVALVVGSYIVARR